MDGFTFFKSYYESAQHLSDQDQAHFYKMIMDYMFTGEEPEIEGHLMGFWLLVKPTLDTSKKRAKAGQKKSNANQTQIKKKSKPKPSPLEEKEKEKDKDKGDIKGDLPEWMDQSVWDQWCKHRREIKKTLTPTTISRQISFLSKHKEDHIAILEQSIQNGWTGLFELKTKQQINMPMTEPEEGSLEWMRLHGQRDDQEVIDAETL